MAFNLRKTNLLLTTLAVLALTALPARARDLFVSDFGNNEVLRYDGTTGSLIDAFVSPNTGGLGGPADLIFGSDNNLYVSDFSKNQVLRYNGTTGAFIDVFVSPGSSGLSAPAGMVFGSDNNLYVCSFLTNAVLRYNGTTGAFIDAFVPPGSGGLSQPQTVVFSPQSVPEPSSDLDILTLGAFVGGSVLLKSRQKKQKLSCGALNLHTPRIVKIKNTHSQGYFGNW